MVETYYPRKPVSFFMYGMSAAFLLLPGLLMIVKTGLWFGAVPIAIWLSLFTLRQGVQVDYNQRQIKFFWGYLGLRFYRGKHFASYTSYRLKRVTEAYALQTRVQRMDVRQEWCALELWNSQKENYERIALGEEEDIRAIAQKVEHHLGIERLVK